MSDIFICYSRKDEAIASKLRERLVTEGWSVFMDLHIDAGHRWSEEIEKELSAARAVLTLWSTNSVRSRFVMDEAHSAADRGVIFPARIEDIAIPYGFRQFQTPDLVGWNGDGDHEEWQRMVATLHKHLNLATDERPVAFRDPLKIGGEGPLMMLIPAGRFLLGSPPDEPERSTDEGPQHEVHIAKPFAMGVYAVTFDEYDRFCESTDRQKAGDNAWGRGNRPVIKVSWNDAQAYCAWLSHQTGRAYRLPSEAEWEYACRAGTTTPFHFGPRITTEQANFDGNYTYNGSAKGEYREKTTPVGAFPPNAFGLHDMHGNVWEWCQDAWHDSYDGSPTDGSAWECGEGVPRVLRGGSWGYDPRRCRAAVRVSFVPGLRNGFIGFRVCCASPIE
jgi:formylglycine-generating enzyme required for sulfatase activity